MTTNKQTCTPSLTFLFLFQGRQNASLSHANKAMILTMGTHWLQCRGRSWSHMRSIPDIRVKEERRRKWEGKKLKCDLIGKVLRGVEGSYLDEAETVFLGKCNFLKIMICI